MFGESKNLVGGQIKAAHNIGVVAQLKKEGERYRK
jgi:hypothetical protein